jgi:tryptophan synthase alpha chain
LSRIAATFARTRAEGRPALVAFLTAGYPSLGATPALVQALARGGADMVELGIPFSDPLADGVTIQRAGLAALRQGVTAADCLRVVGELRSQGLEIPLLLMGYYNPILAYGPEAFVAAAAAAGGDGLIVVDLPPEESEGLRDLCRARDLDLIYLLAPTSGRERIDRVARLASGFIYCVSVAGVTGARADLPPGLAAFVREVRDSTGLPLVVGFGISCREHIEAAAAMGLDGAVVGSAIINVIEHSDTHQQADEVREYVEVLTGHRRANVRQHDGMG